MSLATTLIDVARMVHNQGTRPNFFFVNPRDYAELQDTFEYSDVETAIREAGGTYRDLTTRLGQLAAARRMARRRGKRFHAKQWVAK